MAIRFEVGAARYVGGREMQQDAYAIDSRACWVADGMGGHAAGDVASQIAVETVEPLAARSELTEQEVLSTVLEAHRQIRSYAAEHHPVEGMGTTLTGIVVVQENGEDLVLVVNVGDSRTYAGDPGAESQITRDHSEVQDMVEAGYITAAEAEVHPLRHVVTRSLGNPSFPGADSWVIEDVEPGVRFILASDGLFGVVSLADIQAASGACADPAEAAQKLAQAALDAGTPDNVTVVVADAL